MKTRNLPLPIAIVIPVAIVIGGACSSREDQAGFPTLTGEYLGQPPPGEAPELFAPGIVSTGMYTRDVAMTPDGNEFYYGVALGPFTVIMQTKLENGRWTEPEVAPFSANPNYMNLEPHITPDGQRFLFLSNRPADGGELAPEQVGTWTNQDIWAMDRTEDGWGEPYNLGPPVNSDAEEYFPSVTSDGTIYFTRQTSGTQEGYIYRSRLVDGAYQEPERLPPQINSTTTQFNAFIAPDESYLILSVFGRPDSKGSADYYVVFRNEDDAWSEPVNAGDAVNTPRGGEWSPYVTPDGRYFFFMSSRPRPVEDRPERLTADYLWDAFKSSQNGNADIYWVDASFIDELRPPGFER
ncbi:MAG: PD40 domain-containing protein [Gemmatimonadota bacterium]|nr:MAG: PD40 domain-containing protein [Gemmatimonadota bacterium]